MRKAAFVAVALFISSFLSPLPATALEPQIEFLYPSVFAAQVPAPEISDKQDADGAVHLTASVQEVPLNPTVEFELQPAAGAAITIDGLRVGNTDTWGAFFTVPDSLMDGPNYTFTARLFDGQEEVDIDQQAVTLNQSDVVPPPASETVELSYPANGGDVGFHTPKGGRPITVLEGTTSEGAGSVRGLYTKSDPGQPPEWVSCGSGGPTDRAVKFACTLAEGDAPVDVTAIAAIANTTPHPGTPDPLADEAGDAHRVFPYVQQPTEVEITPRSVQAEVAECELFDAGVFDQKGRTVARANVDVHAVNPNDQLRFGTFDTSPLTEDTDPYQAPDKAHVSSEAAIQCSDGTNAADARRQGDHNLAGQNDTKHIESVSGTDNNGIFTFALRSDSNGTSFVTAFADDNDDDVSQATEAFGGAQVGWGQPPPPPERTLTLAPGTTSSEIGTCEAMTLTAREGGNPLVGANVDVHITGPDAAVSFCDPENASVRRVPDQGGHVVDAHEDGTHHAEGETNQLGRFVFGVLSATEGTTRVAGWLESSDDDLLVSGEPTDQGSITWQPSSKRSIKINTSRNKVKAGRNVRISGSIKGDPGCSVAQDVVLKARKARGERRFRTVDTTTTDGNAKYRFRVRVARSSDYRTVAPKGDVCRKASSRIVTVRAT